LGGATGFSSAAVTRNATASPRTPEGPLTSAVIADLLAEQLPENAIVVEESVSSGFPLMGALKGAQPHDWLFTPGGALGWAIPGAVGAAIADPNRKIVCLNGDGSAMYSLSGLWVLARENLDVVVVVFANRGYSILKTEFDRVGAQSMGERARTMLSLRGPTIDFVALAHGFGVAAVRTETVVALRAALSQAFAAKGPLLIEAVMPDAIT
jgi:acetolactate synthase-1/2/3 large subunit